ncbi:hypothetical protein IV203_025798 [Nitzschia inconspicua]|uniref:Uncharacterized protein n=1 Tax=Nitzschia inconspicua TaxID=303405 RepID=A0A9K3LHF1_9STRA|nr:hypothetical protein IV203_025798 [Nitzschia inconspicua]
MSSRPSLERRLSDEDMAEITDVLQDNSPVNGRQSEKLRNNNSEHDATVALTVEGDYDEDDESVNRTDDVAALSKTSKLAVSASVAESSSIKNGPKKKEGLPDMYWLNTPEQWTIKQDDDGDKHVKITCPEEVDFWRHTLHGFVKDDGPFYWKFVYGDFEARLTIKGKFHYLYDMAGIMVRQNEDHWMTCGVTNFQDNLQSRFHKHQAKHLYVSTTFTRGKSDWSTHRAMQKKTHKSSVFHVWVRRIGAVIECYYSLDNDLWIKVREGVLAPGVRKLRVGMMCTAPESAGFSVIFSDFMVRGGEKMPEDQIDNLVYKTNGAFFVGMLDKQEVERRKERDKQRMLKRVKAQKRHDNQNKKSHQKPTQTRQQPASHTRSFETNTLYETDDGDHTRMKTAAVAPTRRAVIALPVKKKQSEIPTKHIIPAAKPAREIPKERPTNPYAVESPPLQQQQQQQQPPRQDHSTSSSAEDAPLPVKKPMANPYATRPIPPPRKAPLPNKNSLPPNKQKAIGRSTNDNVKNNNVKNPLPGSAPVRNEFSGKSLRKASINEPSGKLSKFSDHLGNPLRKKSEIGRRRPSTPHGVPARSQSDAGPQRRRPPPPAREYDDREAPKRRKSWFSFGIPKQKKSQEQKSIKRSFRGLLQRNRSGKEKLVSTGSGNVQPTMDTSHTEVQGEPQERPKRPSKLGPAMPQRRLSDDGDANSFGEENTGVDDSPPKRPVRQPSIEDDTDLLSSDGEAQGNKSKAEPKEKKSKKKKKKKKGQSGSNGSILETTPTDIDKKKKKKRKKSHRKREELGTISADSEKEVNKTKSKIKKKKT